MAEHLLPDARATAGSSSLPPQPVQKVFFGLSKAGCQVPCRDSSWSWFAPPLATETPQITVTVLALSKAPHSPAHLLQRDFAVLGSTQIMTNFAT